MLYRCEKEIKELHTFFTNWFTGEIGNNDTNFNRFHSVISPKFELISPNGDKFNYENIISIIKMAHGSKQLPKHSFNIKIKNVNYRFNVHNVHVVTYEEWQVFKSKETIRLRTVVFQEMIDAPNSLQWLHVHETWLQQNIKKV